LEPDEVPVETTMAGAKLRPRISHHRRGSAFQHEN
jgi:hypothetical protein